ncbi:hypothetical protein [Streptomyces zhihengii]|uniref:hypothetical protein n=1 Tax=Streptomyces zhihengii TaxID=1818004 RepID=UPI001FD503E4|nr:hypothetical protein [Streptomyces zhihengii]
MQPGFPLARAPHDALVTAVLAWKDPDLAPADDEQITGHARAVAAERAANIQAEDDYQHQEEEAVTLLGLADGPPATGELLLDQIRLDLTSADRRGGPGARCRTNRDGEELAVTALPGRRLARAGSSGRCVASASVGEPTASATS